MIFDFIHIVPPSKNQQKKRCMVSKPCSVFLRKAGHPIDCDTIAFMHSIKKSECVSPPSYSSAIIAS